MSQDQVERLDSDFSMAAGEWRRLVADCLPAELTRRLRPHTWSAAECVEHLNLSGKAFLPQLRDGVSQLEMRRIFSGGSLRMAWNARLLRWWLEPPARLKVTTRAAFMPAATTNLERVTIEFTLLQDNLRELLRQGAGLALDEWQIVSPFAKNIRYDIYSAFVLIAAHQRRHLWQANNVVARLRSLKDSSTWRAHSASS